VRNQSCLIFFAIAASSEYTPTAAFFTGLLAHQRTLAADSVPITPLATAGKSFVCFTVQSTLPRTAVQSIFPGMSVILTSLVMSVILSEACRGLIATGVVEGSAVCSRRPTVSAIR
jgi:hypothetical protein